MPSPLILTKKNRLARSEHFEEIIRLYREQFEASGGKLNEGIFYKQHIAPRVPGFKLNSWYQFLRRFRNSDRTISLQKVNDSAKEVIIEKKSETALANTILDNQTATQKGISIALTLGAQALEELLSKPELLAKLTPAQRAKFLFDAMKAQDSRIKAIRTIREDNRDQQKFDHAFSGAAY